MIWDSMTSIIMIYASSALALVWAFYNAMVVTTIKVEESNDDEESLKLKDQRE